MVITTRGQLDRDRQVRATERAVLATYLCPDGHTLTDAPVECPFGHRTQRPVRQRRGRNQIFNSSPDNLKPVPANICMDYLSRGACPNQCPSADRCTGGFHPNAEDLSDLDAFILRVKSPSPRDDQLKVELAETKVLLAESERKVAMLEDQYRIDQDTIAQLQAQVARLQLGGGGGIAAVTCEHLNSLPDDCLLNIFDRIPLSDLLRLDHVCHRWAALLSSTCARRRTLVLIGGGLRLDEMRFVIPFNSAFLVFFQGRKPFYNLPLVERKSSLTLPSFVPPHDQSLEGNFDNPQALFTEMARFRIARHSHQLVIYLAGLFPNVDRLVVIHTECYQQELPSLISLCFHRWR